MSSNETILMCSEFRRVPHLSCSCFEHSCVFAVYELQLRAPRPSAVLCAIEVRLRLLLRLCVLLSQLFIPIPSGCTVSLISQLNCIAV